MPGQYLGRATGSAPHGLDPEMQSQLSLFAPPLSPW
jgi:hypothetical protein